MKCIEFKEKEQRTLQLTCQYLEHRRYKHGNFILMHLHGNSVEKHIKRRVDDGDVGTIIEYMVSYGSIHYLDLSYNKITSKGFLELSEYLSKDHTLISLNLMYNDIESIDYIVPVLSRHWNLRRLVLSGNKFASSESISTIIQTNESLIQFELSDTDQDMTSTVNILESFIPEYRPENSSSNIKALHLNRIIPRSKIVETIYMSHVFRFLDKVLLSHKFVRLSLSQNNITDFDIEILQDALSRCTLLESLNLTANLLTDRGLELLATVLPFTAMEELILSANRIGDAGVSALGSIWSRTKIQYLDLSKNQIAGTGLLDLLDGMKKRSLPVVLLFLFGNPFTQKTVRELYNYIYLGHVRKLSVDLQFDWDTEGKLLLFEDSTFKFNSLYGLTLEATKYKKIVKILCCENTEQELKKKRLEEKQNIVMQLLGFKVKLIHFAKL